MLSPVWNSVSVALHWLPAKIRDRESLMLSNHKEIENRYIYGVATSSSAK